MSALTTDLLLIYPPAAKPAEPPAGVAQIKQALQSHGRSCRVIDANLEGQLYLINSVHHSDSPRVKSAIRNRDKNLAVIRDIASFAKFDHYKRAVLETSRLLNAAAAPFHAAISFTSFEQQGLKPVRSDDLLHAAEAPQENPFYAYFEKKLLPRVLDSQPGIIGISLIYLSQALTTFALIGFLRRHVPTIKIILGGGLITSWMSQPGWSDPFRGLVDACIPGRGERAVLELLDIKTQSTSFPPSFEENRDSYFSPGCILPYAASHGCYWRRCAFCPETTEGAPFHTLPHHKIFDDLKHLSRPRPSLIHFLDDALSPSLLHKIAQRRLPAPWYGYVRFTREFEELDFCMALKTSGCILLQIGLESGDQDVLDKMQKGIELPRVSRILRNLQKAGIDTFIYLLFGTPYETIEQARRTVKFTLDHADCIQYLNPAIFNMPVHSTESNIYATRQFYEGDLALYHNFDHPKGWQRGLVRQFLQNEFQSHAAIKSKILANPPFFTSNHAPFFTDHFLQHESK